MRVAEAEQGATTVSRPAVAAVSSRVVGGWRRSVGRPQAIVEGQLFTAEDLPHGVDIDPAVEDVGLAIGIAAVVEVPGLVAVPGSVDGG